MKKIAFLFSLVSFLSVGVAIAQEGALAPPIPTLAILEPLNGQEFARDEEVILNFAVEDFVFVDFKNNSEAFPGNPNAGHAHLWIDDVEWNHEQARKLLSGDPVTLGILERGTHTAAMELTQNDHAAYEPRVRASVEFTISGKNLAGEGEGFSLGGGGGLIALILLAAALAGFFIGWRKRVQLRLYLQKMMRKT